MSFGVWPILVLACLLIASGLIGLAIVPAHRWLGRRGRAADLRRALEELGAQLGAVRAEDGFVAEHAGRRLRARLSAARGAPQALEIAVDLDEVARDPAERPAGYRDDLRARVRGRPEIRITKKTPWDRVVERLPVLRPARSGDAAFDAEARIAAAAPAADVRAALADERARGAIGALFAAGVDRITVNDGGSALGAAFLDPKVEHVNPFAFREVADALAALASALPLFEGDARPGPRRVAASTLASAVALAAGAALLAAWAWPEETPARVEADAEAAANTRRRLAWTLVARGPLAVRLVGIWYGKPSLKEVTFDMRITNEADAPRWFLIPTRIEGLSGLLTASFSELSALEWRDRGRVVVTEVKRWSDGDFQALLLPARATVTLYDVRVDAHVEDLPDVAAIHIPVARSLSIEGEPAERWLGYDPRSEDGAVLEPRDRRGQGRLLRRLDKPGDRPMAIDYDEERRLRTEVLLRAGY